MIDAAHTVKRHWDGILRWFENKIANGLIEGITSLVQAGEVGGSIVRFGGAAPFDRAAALGAKQPSRARLSYVWLHPHATYITDNYPLSTVSHGRQERPRDAGICGFRGWVRRRNRRRRHRAKHAAQGRLWGERKLLPHVIGIWTHLAETNRRAESSRNSFRPIGTAGEGTQLKNADQTPALRAHRTDIVAWLSLHCAIGLFHVAADVPSIGIDPLGRDRCLRFCQRQLAAAHRPVELILQLVLPVGSPAGAQCRPAVCEGTRRLPGRLRPQP